MSIDIQNVSPQEDGIPQTIDAADLIVRYIESIGVEHIFGVPGGAIEPLYNALARSSRNGGLRVVGACHETGAAYMADGYHRESGKLGVCLATSGPGATNLITGVSCAYDNNIPLLVITGQPTITSFGKGALQESACTGVNIVAMFRHCTKYNSLVSHVEQLETKLIAAILRAHQMPCGPVHLSIPVDILRASVADKNSNYDLCRQISLQQNLCDERAISELYSELAQPQPPLFFIGNGTSDAIDKIMQLVDICNALFVTTSDAKGLVNVRHPSYRGVFGLGGHSSAALSFRYHNATIVAFGAGFGEFSSAGWNHSLMNGQLIHVDQNVDHLQQTPMAKLHVQGAIDIICGKLIECFYLNGRASTSKKKMFYKYSNPHVVVEDAAKFHSPAAPIKPQRLMKELSERFPSNTRFVADAGNSMMWAPHYLQPKSQRENSSEDKQPLPFQNQRTPGFNWLRLTLNFAPMGWAIGASVGIARANPRNPVVCITGDGSYLMSGQEITVAARERLPVIFVILNDSVYGMVMHGQRLAEAEPIGFQLPTINFAKLADAMGIQSHVIQSPSDFNELDIDTIVQHNGPTLLDIRIDREEIPPMITRLKALGSIEESMAS